MNISLTHPGIAKLIPRMLLVVLASTALHAQPVLEFKSIDASAWPRVEAKFLLTCRGQPVGIPDLRHVSATEDGLPILTDFSFFCPDPPDRFSISVALVFDASGSMVGGGNAGARAGGNAFIDMMDGWNDEAAIVWFGSIVNVAQGMTTYLDLLHNAVNLLPADGMTAMWDGAYAGLQEIIASGFGYRALILLTDGADNASTKTRGDVVTLALKNRIRVYTIGLGSGVNSTALLSLADTTDGRYFGVTNPGNLPSVYQAIYLDFWRPGPCQISYTSTCSGASHRTIQIAVSDVCDGSTSRTKIFTVPGAPVIEGPRAVCRAEVNAYSVPHHPGSRYVWETGTTVPNGLKGTILGRNDSSAVRIVWPNGNLSPGGYVAVREVSGSCTLTDSIAVDLKLYAYPIIDVLGPDQFCEGDSVILDAGGLWDSFRWSTGDTTRFIVVKRSGVYQVLAGWRDGCGDMSPQRAIRVFPKPAAPVISRSGDVLHCGTQAAAYQWQHMGVPIAGATSQDHTLTMTGVYFVTITDTNGCTNTSSPFNVLSLPVQNLPPDDVSIDWYPQPVRGDFTVRFGYGNVGSTRISIMDILGRAVFSKTVDTDHRGSVLIPFENPLPGFYVLTLENGTRILSLPFLKVR